MDRTKKETINLLNNILIHTKDMENIISILESRWLKYSPPGGGGWTDYTEKSRKDLEEIRILVNSVKNLVIRL
ncbi:MAG: hypothetical protein KJ767_03540 [Nanoarchaeota archaeon]|nr:hypothetical protein [Nanoarchaeota archaeon]